MLSLKHSMEYPVPEDHSRAAIGEGLGTTIDDGIATITAYAYDRNDHGERTVIICSGTSGNRSSIIEDIDTWPNLGDDIEIQEERQGGRTTYAYFRYLYAIFLKNPLELLKCRSKILAMLYFLFL